MRVIIIGSGPAGLGFAHCLLKAGIDDFVILEQRPNPADRLGAALGLWPHAVRILDQLGILDEARKLVPEMKKSLHLGPKGDLISESDLFQMVVAKWVLGLFPPTMVSETETRNAELTILSQPWSPVHVIRESEAHAAALPLTS